MPLEVSYRLHVVGDAPKRDVVLPELPGSSPYQPGVLDLFGEQVQRSWPILGGAGIAGAIGGSKLLRMGGGGVFKGLLGGVAGAIGGVVLAGAGLALHRGNGAHEKPDSVRRGEVADTTVVARERLKVMTYNIHGGMGGPEEFFSTDKELDELAEVIRRERPDVLLLQENDRFTVRSNFQDDLAELAERLDADSAVGAPAMTAITGRDQEVAVLTFNGNTISDARNIVHADPRGGGFGVRASAWWRDMQAAAGSVLNQDWGQGGQRYQVRNTIEAMVRTPAGNAVRVLSGHYEWPTREVNHQQRQVGDVAAALDAWDGATIWGADFNVQKATSWGFQEQRIMADAGLRDAFDAVEESRRIPVPERSSHPDRPTDPGGGIDRIYVSDQFDVHDTHVVREAGAASDHLPVVSTVELRPDES